MLEDLRCVSKFHISNLTPLMLAAGISPYGSCCRQQVTLQLPFLQGLSETYPTVAAHFWECPAFFLLSSLLSSLLLFVNCPSVMTSGTDRAIRAFAGASLCCSTAPAQPSPHCDPPCFPRRIASPALTRPRGSGPWTQPILYNIYINIIYIYLYLY